MFSLKLNHNNNDKITYSRQLTLRIIALCLTLVSTTAFALKNDVEKPVNIQADTVLFNRVKGLAVYEGNVNITQGTLEIRAHKIEIFAPDNEIEKIIAQGNPVSFKQKMDDGKLVKGGANRVIYQIKNKRLFMDGNAFITSGKDKFSSNHIEYSIQSGELKAGNKKSPAKNRVNVIFYPTNKAK